MDTLVALHAVDPARVGLADFGRPAGFLQRQLGRWHTAVARVADPPAADSSTQSCERLDRRRCPSSRRATIVHGDYRLTNVMYRSAPPVASTGSRPSSTGRWPRSATRSPTSGCWSSTRRSRPRGTSSCRGWTRPTGGRRAGELVDRYGRASGRDLGALAWYVAFGYFKLAVVAEGIHHRYLQGKTVGAGFEDFGAAVPRLLDSALAALAGR